MIGLQCVWELKWWDLWEDPLVLHFRTEPNQSAECMMGERTERRMFELHKAEGDCDLAGSGELQDQVTRYPSAGFIVSTRVLIRSSWTGGQIHLLVFVLHYGDLDLFIPDSLGGLISVLVSYFMSPQATTLSFKFLVLMPSKTLLNPVIPEKEKLNCTFGWLVTSQAWRWTWR